MVGQNTGTLYIYIYICSLIKIVKLGLPVIPSSVAGSVRVVSPAVKLLTAVRVTPGTKEGEAASSEIPGEIFPLVPRKCT